MAEYLKLLAQSSEAAFTAALAISWIANQEGEFSGNEQDVVRETARLAAIDPGLARQVIEMPFLGTAEPTDVSALIVMLEIARDDLEVLRQILALPDFGNGITDRLSGLIPLYYLDSRDPESAEAIRSLSWVSDIVQSRVSGREFDHAFGTIRWLQQIATGHPEVFRAIIESDWIRHAPEGITWAHRSSVLDILQIAEVDEDSALQILNLPFLDTLERDDGFVMSFLDALVKDDLKQARRLLSSAAVHDSAQASTTSDFYLLFLRDQGPEVLACLDSIQWLRGGVESFPDKSIRSYSSNSLHQRETLANLVDLYLKSPPVFLRAACLPWMRQAIGGKERTVIDYLLELVSRAPESADQIASMDFLDEFQDEDLSILESMVSLTWSDRSALGRVLSDPALADGITNEELGILLIRILREEDHEAAKAVEDLPWVMDGISSTEHLAVWYLRETALNADQLLLKLLEKPWLRDGLSVDELSVIDRLLWLAREAYRGNFNPLILSIEDTALRILDMPFLDEVDGIDAAAAEALSMLYYLENTDYLHPVLGHPSLKEGITDDKAIVVAAMQRVVRDNPSLLYELLRLTPDAVDRIAVELPLSGEFAISMVSFDGGSERSIQLLETSIRQHEEFMGVRFPTTYAGLVVSDTPNIPGGGGRSGIFSLPQEFAESPHYMSYLVSSAFWGFFPSWLSLGAADLLSGGDYGHFLRFGMLAGKKH